MAFVRILKGRRYYGPTASDPDHGLHQGGDVIEIEGPADDSNPRFSAHTMEALEGYDRPARDPFAPRPELAPEPAAPNPSTAPVQDLAPGDRATQLRIIVGRLDQGNDEHWTKDGLPSMFALGELAREAGFSPPPTRQEVQSVAPEVLRSA